LEIVTARFFLFLHTAGVDTGMPILTFSEYVAMREGVLSPSRPLLKGMSRINPLPISGDRRKRLHPKPVKAVKPFTPTVRAVAEVVPQRFVLKIGQQR
jgi:hypothetical protein